LTLRAGLFKRTKQQHYWAEKSVRHGHRGDSISTGPGRV
jgi:hypothetical protein